MRCKGNIRIVVICLVIIAAQLLFMIGYQKTRLLREKVWLTSVKNSDYLSPQAIYELSKTNAKTDPPLTFLAWRELKSEVLLKELNKVADTVVILASERIDIILPDCIPFDSEYPSTCIISDSLAYELTGEKNVKGMKITYDNQEYKIIQVIKSNKKLFVYYKDINSDINSKDENNVDDQYSEITIDNIKNDSPKKLKGILEERIGVSLYQIDYAFLCYIYESLFVVFLLTILLTIRKEIAKKVKAGVNKEKIERFWDINILKFMLIIVLIGIIILTFFQGFSVDLLPTRFSDKNFWTSLLTEQKKSLEYIFVKAKQYPELNGYVGYNIMMIACIIGFFNWLSLKRILNHMLTKKLMQHNGILSNGDD